MTYLHPDDHNKPMTFDHDSNYGLTVCNSLLLLMLLRLSSLDWLVLKLDITNVWMLDYYGPSTDVPVKDYFDAKV